MLAWSAVKRKNQTQRFWRAAEKTTIEREGAIHDEIWKSNDFERLLFPELSEEVCLSFCSLHEPPYEELIRNLIGFHRLRTVIGAE